MVNSVNNANELRSYIVQAHGYKRVAVECLARQLQGIANARENNSKVKQHNIAVLLGVLGKHAERMETTPDWGEW